MTALAYQRQRGERRREKTSKTIKLILNQKFNSEMFYSKRDE